MLHHHVIAIIMKLVNIAFALLLVSLGGLPYLPAAFMGQNPTERIYVAWWAEVIHRDGVVV